MPELLRVPGLLWMLELLRVSGLLWMLELLWMPKLLWVPGLLGYMLFRLVFCKALAEDRILVFCKALAEDRAHAVGCREVFGPHAIAGGRRSH